MPFCTYCGASFARDEHLERHILTHTGVRPYKCAWCHMSFARKDLLHRHQQMVHERNRGSDSASLAITSRPAGRTPIACSNCAKNKTKCDKKFPCSRCASRNLKCEMRPAQRPSKKMPRPEPIKVRKDDSEGSSDPSQDDHTSHSGTNSSGSSTPSLVTKSRNSSRSDDSVDIAHSFREQLSSSHHSRQTSTTTISSMCQSPTTTFSLHSPPPTLETFMKNGNRPQDDFAAEFDGNFNFDWSSLNKSLSQQYDPLCHTDMLWDPSTSYQDPSLDGLPSPASYIPLLDTSFGTNSQSVCSPKTPHAFDTTPFPELHQRTQYAEDFFYKERAHSHTSSIESGSSSDIDATVMSQDAWPAFRCTSSIPSSRCPRTARLYLDKLEEMLRNHDAWDDWNPVWNDADYALGNYLEVVPFREGPRDKLLAITQFFMQKASEAHVDDAGPTPSTVTLLSRSSFMILPPSRVLDCCMKSYGNGFERFYPLSAKRTLDPNAIMYSSTDKASSLLLLMMIAQGAQASPAIDGRWLVGGLTEACRISLFDLIEKSITLAGDPVILHSGLLFTSQAGWSGDKWQMDTAMGQRGKYFSLLKHAGYLEEHPQTPITFGADPNGIWHEWTGLETRSRLLYSWMMVDQELSLFHDTSPLLLATEFGTPMPDAETAWQAQTAEEWSAVFEQIHTFTGGLTASGLGTRPRSLRDVFKLFTEDSIASQNVMLTALHLRLLLQPLQSLVYQFGHLMSCLPETKSISTASQGRLEEVETLLQRWYCLAERYMSSNPICPTMHASLVLFHLISLNVVSSMPQIERLARCEGVDGSLQSIMWAHKSCITDGEKALFHSGQILRLVKSMPPSIRPPWWAGAIYRAGLVLWCNSLVQSGRLGQAGNFASNEAEHVPLDKLKPGHAAISRYLSRREGTPVLTKRDCSALTLDNPSAVLLHCVELISEGVSTRFTEGISGKLVRLGRS